MAESDDLLAAAIAARERAYAPYSKFAVGAAIRTPSGAIHTGCNVENASYPEGWCAETSAIAAMVAAGERMIAEVVVCAESEAPTTPCGGCRQRLAEFGRADTVVRAAGPQGERARWTLGALLPAAFSLGDQE
jgi:cytidine deaminase